ncbi:MAG: non-canonical purine NTP pyrophosphatase [bacterium]|nr:non-canonical purine NTP pyrophosphatase [bacterium]
MKLSLVTGNKNKVREFKLLMGSDLEAINLEYPELKSDDPCEISRIAAKTLAEKMKKTVIVEDSGLFVKALNDFPGTSTKYIFNRIGNKGTLKLMKGVKDRKCWYKSAIGYCEPGKQPISFLGTEEGKIASKEKGTAGWGQDPIFIPKGKQKTYGETRKPGDVNIFRKRAIEKLIAYLEDR